MGFIFCGIMVVVAFFIPVFMTQLPPYNTHVSEFSFRHEDCNDRHVFVTCTFVFFPCLYLYRFSVKMQSAVKAVSQENFDESLMNLKSMFKFYGIFTIVILSFYALVFIIGIMLLLCGKIIFKHYFVAR